MAFLGMSFSNFGEEAANGTPREEEETHQGKLIDERIIANSGVNGITNDNHNGGVKSADTSIISIESKHENYSLNSKVENLNHNDLHLRNVYEAKVKEFARTIRHQTTYDHLYHLTFDQLIYVSSQSPLFSKDKGQQIRNITNNKDTLRRNKITRWSILSNKPDLVTKKVLVAYIIYQYFGQNGLNAIDNISRKQKETITISHQLKGAVKFNINAEHLIKQAFAKYIQEEKEATYELIKWHCCQTTIGDSSYRNLKIVRDRVKDKINQLKIKSTEDLLGPTTVASYFKKKWKLTTPKESHKQKKDTNNNTNHEPFKITSNIEQRAIIHSPEMDRQMIQHKNQGISSIMNDINEHKEDGISVTTQKKRIWPAIKENINPINGINHETQNKNRSNNKWKTQEVQNPRIPLVELSRQQAIPEISPSVQQPAFIPPRPRTPSINTHTQSTIRTTPIAPDQQESKEQQQLVEQQWQQLWNKKEEIDNNIHPLEYYTFTTNQIINKIKTTLLPNYMKAIVIKDATTILALKKEYEDLIQEITKQIIHLLYNLYCRYNSQAVKSEIKELTKDTMYATGLKPDEITDYIYHYFEEYIDYSTYQPNEVFQYRLHHEHMHPHVIEDIRYQANVSVAVKPITRKQALQRRTLKQKHKQPQSVIDEIATQFQMAMQMDETNTAHNQKESNTNNNDDEWDELQGDGIWYLDNKRSKKAHQSNSQPIQPQPPQNSPEPTVHKTPNSNKTPRCVHFGKMDTTRAMESENYTNSSIFKDEINYTPHKRAFYEKRKKEESRDAMGILNYENTEPDQESMTDDEDDANYNFYNKKYSKFANGQSLNHNGRKQSDQNGIFQEEKSIHDEEHAQYRDGNQFGTVPRLFPIQLPNQQIHGNGLSVDEMITFEARKLDFNTAISKFTAVLECDSYDNDRSADDAIDFVYECWKWYKLDIEPHGYIQEATAVNIITHNFRETAKERWDEYNLRATHRITTLRDLTKWIQQTFINAGSFTRLRKRLMNTKFVRARVEQNLPTAFDKFDNHVRVYNSLLYTIDEKTRRQLTIKQSHIFRKVVTYLNKIGKFQQIHQVLRGKREAKPETWGQLRRTLICYQKEVAWIKNFVDSHEKREVTYQDADDPTQTSAANRVQMLNRKRERHPNYYRDQRSTRRNKYNNRYTRSRNNRNDRRSRSRYKSRSHSRHRSNSRRGRYGNNQRYRSRSRSRSTASTRSTYTRRPQNSNKKQSRNGRKYNKYNDKKYRYKNKRKENYRYKRKYKTKDDYNNRWQCRKCGNKHTKGTKCPASQRTKDKYYERRSKRNIHTIKDKKQNESDQGDNTPSCSPRPSEEPTPDEERPRISAICTSPKTSYFIPQTSPRVMMLKSKLKANTTNPKQLIEVLQDQEALYENYFNKICRWKAANINLPAQDYYNKLKQYIQNDLKSNPNQSIVNNKSQPECKIKPIHINTTWAPKLADRKRLKAVKLGNCISDTEWPKRNLLTDFEEVMEIEDEGEQQAKFIPADEIQCGKGLYMMLHSNIQLNEEIKTKSRVKANESDDESDESEIWQNQKTQGCSIVFNKNGSVKSHLCHKCYHPCIGINCKYVHQIPYTLYGKNRIVTAKCDTVNSIGPDGWIYIRKVEEKTILKKSNIKYHQHCNQTSKSEQSVSKCKSFKDKHVFKVMNTQKTSTTQRPEERVDFLKSITDNDYTCGDTDTTIEYNTVLNPIEAKKWLINQKVNKNHFMNNTFIMTGIMISNYAILSKVAHPQMVGNYDTYEQALLALKQILTEKFVQSINSILKEEDITLAFDETDGINVVRIQLTSNTYFHLSMRKFGYNGPDGKYSYGRTLKIKGTATRPLKDAIFEDKNGELAKKLYALVVNDNPEISFHLKHIGVSKKNLVLSMKEVLKNDVYKKQSNDQDKVSVISSSNSVQSVVFPRLLSNFSPISKLRALHFGEDKVQELRQSKPYLKWKLAMDANTNDQSQLNELKSEDNNATNENGTGLEKRSQIENEKQKDSQLVETGINQPRREYTPHLRSNPSTAPSTVSKDLAAIGAFDTPKNQQNNKLNPCTLNTPASENALIAAQMSNNPLGSIAETLSEQSGIALTAGIGNYNQRNIEDSTSPSNQQNVTNSIYYENQNAILNQTEDALVNMVKENSDEPSIHGLPPYSEVTGRTRKVEGLPPPHSAQQSRLKLPKELKTVNSEQTMNRDQQQQALMGTGESEQGIEKSKEKSKIQNISTKNGTTANDGKSEETDLDSQMKRMKVNLENEDREEQGDEARNQNKTDKDITMNTSSKMENVNVKKQTKLKKSKTRKNTRNKKTPKTKETKKVKITQDFTEAGTQLATGIKLEQLQVDDNQIGVTKVKQGKNKIDSQNDQKIETAKTKPAGSKQSINENDISLSNINISKLNSEKSEQIQSGNNQIDQVIQNLGKANAKPTTTLVTPSKQRKSKENSQRQYFKQHLTRKGGKGYAAQQRKIKTLKMYEYHDYKRNDLDGEDEDIDMISGENHIQDKENQNTNQFSRQSSISIDDSQDNIPLATLYGKSQVSINNANLFKNNDSGITNEPPTRGKELSNIKSSKTSTAQPSTEDQGSLGINSNKSSNTRSPIRGKGLTGLLKSIDETKNDQNKLSNDKMDQKSESDEDNEGQDSRYQKILKDTGHGQPDKNILRKPDDIQMKPPQSPERSGNVMMRREIEQAITIRDNSARPAKSKINHKLDDSDDDSEDEGSSNGNNENIRKTNVRTKELTIENLKKFDNESDSDVISSCEGSIETNTGINEVTDNDIEQVIEKEKNNKKKNTPRKRKRLKKITARKSTGGLAPRNYLYNYNNKQLRSNRRVKNKDDEKREVIDISSDNEKQDAKLSNSNKRKPITRGNHSNDDISKEKQRLGNKNATNSNSNVNGNQTGKIQSTTQHPTPQIPKVQPPQGLTPANTTINKANDDIKEQKIHRDEPWSTKDALINSRRYLQPLNSLQNDIRYINRKIADALQFTKTFTIKVNVREYFYGSSAILKGYLSTLKGFTNDHEEELIHQMIGCVDQPGVTEFTVNVKENLRKEKEQRAQAFKAKRDKLTTSLNFVATRHRRLVDLANFKANTQGDELEIDLAYAKNNIEILKLQLQINKEKISIMEEIADVAKYKTRHQTQKLQLQMHHFSNDEIKLIMDEICKLSSRYEHIQMKDLDLLKPIFKKFEKTVEGLQTSLVLKETDIESMQNKLNMKTIRRKALYNIGKEENMKKKKPNESNTTIPRKKDKLKGKNDITGTKNKKKSNGDNKQVSKSKNEGQMQASKNISSKIDKPLVKVKSGVNKESQLDNVNFDSKMNPNLRVTIKNDKYKSDADSNIIDGNGKKAKARRSDQHRSHRIGNPTTPSSDEDEASDNYNYSKGTGTVNYGINNDNGNGNYNNNRNQRESKHGTGNHTRRDRNKRDRNRSPRTNSKEETGTRSKHDRKRHSRSSKDDNKKSYKRDDHRHGHSNRRHNNNDSRDDKQYNSSRYGSKRRSNDFGRNHDSHRNESHDYEDNSYYINSNNSYNRENRSRQSNYILGDDDDYDRKNREYTYTRHDTKRNSGKNSEENQRPKLGDPGLYAPHYDVKIWLAHQSADNIYVTAEGYPVPGHVDGAKRMATKEEIDRFYKMTPEIINETSRHGIPIHLEDGKLVTPFNYKPTTDKPLYRDNTGPYYRKNGRKCYEIGDVVKTQYQNYLLDKAVQYSGDIQKMTIRENLKTAGTLVIREDLVNYVQCSKPGEIPDKEHKILIAGPDNKETAIYTSVGKCERLKRWILEETIKDLIVKDDSTIAANGEDNIKNIKDTDDKDNGEPPMKRRKISRSSGQEGAHNGSDNAVTTEIENDGKKDNDDNHFRRRQDVRESPVTRSASPHKKKQDWIYNEVGKHEWDVWTSDGHRQALQEARTKINANIQTAKITKMQPLAEEKLVQVDLKQSLKYIKGDNGRKQVVIPSKDMQSKDFITMFDHAKYKVNADGEITSQLIVTPITPKAYVAGAQGCTKSNILTTYISNNDILRRNILEQEKRLDNDLDIADNPDIDNEKALESEEKWKQAGFQSDWPGGINPDDKPVKLFQTRYEETQAAARIKAQWDQFQKRQALTLKVVSKNYALVHIILCIFLLILILTPQKTNALQNTGSNEFKCSKSISSRSSICPRMCTINGKRTSGKVESSLRSFKNDNVSEKSWMKNISTNTNTSTDISENRKEHGYFAFRLCFDSILSLMILFCFAFIWINCVRNLFKFCFEYVILSCVTKCTSICWKIYSLLTIKYRRCVSNIISGSCVMSIADKLKFNQSKVFMSNDKQIGIKPKFENTNSAPLITHYHKTTDIASTTTDITGKDGFHKQVLTNFNTTNKNQSSRILQTQRAAASVKKTFKQDKSSNIEHKRVMKRSKFLGRRANNLSTPSKIGLNTGNSKPQPTTPGPNNYRFITNIKFPTTIEQKNDQKMGPIESLFKEVKVTNQVYNQSQNNVKDSDYAFQRPPAKKTPNKNIKTKPDNPNAAEFIPKGKSKVKHVKPIIRYSSRSDSLNWRNKDNNTKFKIRYNQQRNRRNMNKYNQNRNRRNTNTYNQSRNRRNMNTYNQNQYNAIFKARINGKLRPVIIQCKKCGRRNTKKYCECGRKKDIEYYKYLANKSKAAIKHKKAEIYMEERVIDMCEGEIKDMTGDHKWSHKENGKRYNNGTKWNKQRRNGASANNESKPQISTYILLTPKMRETLTTQITKKICTNLKTEINEKFDEVLFKAIHNKLQSVEEIYDKEKEQLEFQLAWQKAKRHEQWRKRDKEIINILSHTTTNGSPVHTDTPSSDEESQRGNLARDSSSEAPSIELETPPRYGEWWRKNRRERAKPKRAVICTIQAPKVLINTTKDPKENELWQLTEKVRIGENYYTIKLMGDTGASISAIDRKYAKDNFPNHIKKLKRSFEAQTAGEEIHLNEFIEMTFVDPNTKVPITTTDFYLIDNLPSKLLASLYLIRKLGWQITKPPRRKFIHKPHPDETFGKCNNWDNNRMVVNMETTTDIENMNTPYINHINTYIKPTQQREETAAVTRIKQTSEQDTEIHIKKKRIYHISNFKATPDEIEKAKKLTKDKQFQKVNLDHIKKINMDLYNRMCDLCHKKYKDVWAKHQFHMKTIPNREFRIDLKDSAKGQKIYKEQYPLNEEKRLVVTYHALNNIKSGLYEENEYSEHNVPIIVIKRKDGRLRLAYDLTKLNKYTKDTQSYLPSYNYLFEKMRGKGYNTVTDLKNFFENIKLRKSDRKLVVVTTPLGRFQLTHATYGFKNIATIAQEISEDMISTIPNACAFIDDIFVKHGEDDNYDELYKTAERLLLRARQTGVLLHPEKTFFFVEEVEFLGYIFSKNGHRPRPEYIKKVLNIPKPKTVKQIQGYLGLIQYIARYVHKLAEWSHYLTVLTRKDNKGKWGEEQDIAFEQIQDRVKHVKMLYHPTMEDPFLVQCDASKFAIAGVLYQKQWDDENKCRQWKIIEFYSKQIDPHLVKHAIMVKECLAIAYSLNHWKHFLLRKKFFLDTDHKNLISLYDDDETKAPEMRKKPIFQTLRDATALFHFEIAHLAGKDIILADYLSRDGAVNDPHYKQILKKPKMKSKAEKCLFMTAMSKYQAQRTSLFEKSRLRRLVTIPDFRTLKKVKQQVFTMQTLNLDYMKYYCYSSAKQKYTKVLDQKIKCHTYKGSEISMKRQVVTPTTPPSNLEVCDEVKEEHLNKNLGISMINMLHNTTNMDAATANKFSYLYQLYFKGMDKIKTDKIAKPAICIAQVSDEICVPNFNVDDQYRRRGKRIRKKSRPFWDNSSGKSENTGNTVDAQNNMADEDTEDESSENEHEDAMEDELKAEMEAEEQDQRFGIAQTKHRTMFPYSVTPNLAESLYNKLYLPEKYKEIISIENLKKHQRIDWIGQHIYKILTTGKNEQSRKYLKERFPFILQLINKQGFKLKDGIIFRIKDGIKRLFIPAKLIYPVMEYEHTINNLQHPGVLQMRRQMQKRFYWYKMEVDIQKFVQSCHLCQIGKGGIAHKVGRLAPSNLTTHGHTVHFDFAGPFWKRVSILIMICESTGYVELAVTDGQKAEHIIFCLMHYWYPRHGMPVRLISDRGSGFIAESNRLVGKAFGIHNIFTSAYHPQTNAKAERTVQEVKKALRLVNINLDHKYTPNKLDPRKVTQLVKELTLLIPAIQFSINQRIHSITKVSPNMLVFGRNLRTKIDHNLGVELLTKLSKEIKHPSKYELVKQLQYMIRHHEEQQKKEFDDYIVIMQKNFDKDKHDDEFVEGDLVAYYIGDRSAKLKKIRQRFTAPWRITQRLQHNVVRIERVDNPKEVLACHVSSLKKYNKRNFVPLTEFRATETAKDRIIRKNEEKRLRQLRKKKKGKLKKAKDVSPRVKASVSDSDQSEPEAE